MKRYNLIWDCQFNKREVFNIYGEDDKSAIEQAKELIVEHNMKYDYELVKLSEPINIK